MVIEAHFKEKGSVKLLNERENVEFDGNYREGKKER